MCAADQLIYEGCQRIKINSLIAYVTSQVRKELRLPQAKSNSGYGSHSCTVSYFQTNLRYTRHSLDHAIYLFFL